MTWLLDCGLIYKITRIAKPGMPLMAYEDLNAFKLFLLDVGLLGALSDIDVKSIINGNKFFEEFKGALTEQFVLQQLKATNEIRPHYWSSDKRVAEIDFVFQNGTEVVPLEVKASENLQAKSLKSYFEKYEPNIAVRTSLSDYREENWVINLPLYCIHAILDIIYDSSKKMT